MNARCCGIAGTYGLKVEKYDIAMAVGRDLFDQVRDSGRGDGRLRQRDVPLADRARHRAPVRAPDRLPAPRVRALRADRWSGSSSSPIAPRWPRAWSTLAREMGGEELALEAAGGIDEAARSGPTPSGCMAAIERAMSADGVLVLMDLGSALMSAEIAVEMLGESRGPVLLSEAPLVEGAVAAAVAARGGASLDEVAAEARGALAMKTAQLGVDRRCCAAAEAPLRRVRPMR